jgi:hypothetical protein
MSVKLYFRVDKGAACLRAASIFSESKDLLPRSVFQIIKEYDHTCQEEPESSLKEDLTKCCLVM